MLFKFPLKLIEILIYSVYTICYRRGGTVF